MAHTTETVISPEGATRLRGDDKRAYVRTMFDRLAPRYDRLNLVISLGQTSLWRRRALADLGLEPGARVLDVGCGTGWVVQHLRKRYPGSRVEGMDLSPGMLEEAQRIDPNGAYFEGDVCQIPREDGTYDLVTTVFTSRNFPDLERSVREMLRVLAPGGRLLVLDSFPSARRGPWAAVQTFWMRWVVPVLVRPFADTGAYGYLAASIENHVDAATFVDICRRNGADAVRAVPYSLGSATCVVATRNGSG